MSDGYGTAAYSIGFDIGGTFTDFALLDHATGRVRVHKILTTPRSPATGALDGIQAVLARENVTPAQIGQVIHGTTLVANTLIQRSGATVGLITTQGFRDALEMRTEQRYDIYNLFLRYPEPLVPRRLRRAISERTDRDGRILVEPSEDEVRNVVSDFRDAQVQAVAICFLHAFRNPRNEHRVAELVRQLWPEVPVSTSSEVAPQIREYERSSTTVANAYVQPLLRDYLEAIRRGLESLGFRGAFYPMLSSGGVASLAAANAVPIQLVESGPAAGATAAAFFGELHGEPDLISFDMGGTTAKMCVIQHGRPATAPSMEVARVSRFQPGSGIPLQIPTIELLEIGAGGGSIAWIDVLDLLRVGPASAGADPGPACYGRDGIEPTVTDADLLLGYLDPEYFLGGGMRLDRQAAQQAVDGLAHRLNLSRLEAAWAIHSVVNEHMAAGTRMHMTEKSIDPRRYTLLAFGGCGPVHAASVARVLHVARVIYPPSAGVASAIGLLVAPPLVELARSYPVVLDRIHWPDVVELLRALEDHARHRLAEVGVSPGEITVERSVDGRFVGQLHEITIPLPATVLTDTPDQLRAQLLKTFFDRYRALFKHLPSGIPVELLSWRLTARGPRRPIQIQPSKTANADPRRALKGMRPVYFGAECIETPVYSRYELLPAMCFDGPAIVEERESTIVLPPATSAELDPYLNLVVHL